MANKLLGYILLIAGLVLIAWAVWQSYNIFTAKTEAPLVFKTPSFQESSLDSQDIQTQINQVVQNQLMQIFSPAALTKIFNLIAWSIMALILIWAGGAIAGIGVKLIK